MTEQPGPTSRAPDLFSTRNAASADANATIGRNAAAQRTGGELNVRADAAARSALWSAWGDAVGWVSELTDAAGLRRRLRGQTLRGPVSWRRRVGGRMGVDIDIPAGMYSDDTQLRLAVMRAIGPRGFDLEAFSRVELTVWLSYGLGGGVSTKAAAAAMARPGARWSINRPDGYYRAGGNGSAMRIQPHAWRPMVGVEALLRNVFRDAATTHGHPRAIVGAAFHALAVADVMPGGNGDIARSGTRGWAELVKSLMSLADVPEADPELAAFWLPNWESNEHADWRTALKVTVEELQEEISLAAEIVDTANGVATGYDGLLQALDLYGADSRGSGTRTALAALALAALARRHDIPPDEALLTAARAVGSDTDTIATMAGAILGCLASEAPQTFVVDSSCIAAEAHRIAIHEFPAEGPVRYPDLLTWEAPRTQADALQLEDNGHLLVAGLGSVIPLGDPVGARGEFAWQFMRTQYGQTLLIKRRSSLPRARATSRAAPIPESPPTDRHAIVREQPRNPSPTGGTASYGEQGQRPHPPEHSAEGTSPSRSRPANAGGDSPTHVPGRKDAVKPAPASADTLAAALQYVRERDYEARAVGYMLTKLANEVSPEMAASFGAVIATELGQRRRMTRH